MTTSFTVNRGAAVPRRSNASSRIVNRRSDRFRSEATVKSHAAYSVERSAPSPAAASNSSSMSGRRSSTMSSSVVRWSRYTRNPRDASSGVPEESTSAPSTTPMR